MFVCVSQCNVHMETGWIELDKVSSPERWLESITNAQSMTRNSPCISVRVCVCVTERETMTIPLFHYHMRQN